MRHRIRNRNHGGGRTLKELERQVMDKQTAKTSAYVHDPHYARNAYSNDAVEKAAPVHQSSARAALETVHPAHNAHGWAAARQALTTKTLAVRHAKGPDGTRGFAVGRGRGRQLNAEKPVPMKPPPLSRYAKSLGEASGEEDDDFD